MSLVSYSTQISNNFPLTLEESFQLQEQLALIKCKYDFAIYVDCEGNEYIAKMCEKLNENKLNELRNEDLAYKALLKLSKNIKNSNVSFPKHFLTYEDKDIFLILLERVNGDTLRQLPIKVKIKSIQQSFTYLNKLYEFAKEDDAYILEVFKKRYVEQFVLLAPFMALLAVVKNPFEFAPIMKSFLKMMLHAPKVIKTTDYGFVHKDLNTSNIIKSGNKLSIIDLQLFCISIKAHDFANTFYSMWEKDYELEMALFLSETLSDTKNRDEYKFFLYYSVLFDMSLGSNRIQGKAKQYITFLFRII